MTLGEGIEAVAALASTGALIAALVALRNQRKELALQRAELKLQREELAANREVMKEQAEQAKATAEAQKRLAASQEELARAQRRAVEEAQITRLAMHSGTIATLRSTLARIEVERSRTEPTVFGNAFREFVSPAVAGLRERLNREEQVEGNLRTFIDSLEVSDE